MRTTRTLPGPWGSPAVAQKVQGAMEVAVLDTRVLQTSEPAEVAIRINAVPR